MEMSALLRCQAEIEKLKMLLFDDDQYSLFEMIPKPFLMDIGMVKQNRTKKELNDRGNIVVTQSLFWKKESSFEKLMGNSVEAMKRIKCKEELDIIDEKLLELLESMNYS